MAALDNLFVLDFSTLLPGPMATLILADAGAEVVKIERPGSGEDMRGYEPVVDGDSVNFTLLNRSKTSLAVDLKDPAALTRLRPLIEKADVIVEQFRPGVMARLGLGYEDIKAIKSDIVYCSITGWGQTGPKAFEAGHDLNYMAETGVLGLTCGSDGAPILPPILAADIGGGAYPAVMNILLALRERDRSGNGCWIDVAMGENLFPFIYWAIGNARAVNAWPVPGGDLVTGGTPRYHIYRTRDDKFIAAAPLEDKFWANFVEAIKLSANLRDDSRDPGATRDAVTAIIREKNAADWVDTFKGIDVCCSIVKPLEDALTDPHWKARRIFERTVDFAGSALPALPSIVAPGLRVAATKAAAPKLGNGNKANGL